MTGLLPGEIRQAVRKRDDKCQPGGGWPARRTQKSPRSGGFRQPGDASERAQVDLDTAVLRAPRLAGVARDVMCVRAQGGGHMRIVIGYNQKTDEVIYTDSWGPGHEFKRMSTANAYTATMHLITLKPSQ